MSVRNYNAFLRAVKKQHHGTTHAQAQAIYRGVKARLGRSAKGIDVSRHPRITGDVVRGVRKTRNTVKAGGSISKAGKTGTRSVKTIAEWRRLYREGVPSERQVIVSSADYGTKKKGRK